MNTASDNPKLCYEDFTPGRAFALGPLTVDAEEIVEFAAEFDPQPMHLDEAAGRESLLGGLAASGWQTCGLIMRMMAQSYILNSTAQGAPKVDYVRWKRPVLAGDVLSGVSRVLSARPLKSRPGLGIVQFEQEIHNQRGELVCECSNPTFFAMRDKSDRQ
ncbi:MaoC family dehydratase [Hoeflea sp. WL0058]|uniref:MaoC family dehydratase n=1 Tax=Flavimaribacter sediminis TaxID=2865987 RepID=A0AAE2ZLK1_9HYPH|nr:MaoC family dehydratase [Flavimaribacter sediminis]MBW8638793.1 MaoC family dehydratase [Flavimaribacter sediminis]